MFKNRLKPKGPFRQNKVYLRGNVFQFNETISKVNDINLQFRFTLKILEFSIL